MHFRYSQNQLPILPPDVLSVCISLSHTYTPHTFPATAVFVAPDSRVYIVPDIVPMLCKMHTTLGAPGFNPRTLDIEAIHQLFTLLIPPTINQNRSWVRKKSQTERRGREREGEEGRRGRRKEGGERNKERERSSNDVCCIYRYLLE